MEPAPGVNLASILAYHARVRPHALALADAEQEHDFGTLHRRVNRLAKALIRSGIRRGDRVGVRFANSHRHFEFLFACAKLGAIMVPINPNAPPDEQHHVVRETDPAMLFDSEAACDAAVDGIPEGEAPSVGAADDPLLIMYTSGTTGPAKGVVLTQANIIYSCFNQILGWQLSTRDLALVVAPLHHVGGLIALGLPTLYSGGGTRLASAAPEAIVAALDRGHVTALFLPPTLWGRLARCAALERIDLDTVRLCASGGDPVPVAVLEYIIDRFQTEFTDAYGLTEAASAVTILHGDEIIRHSGSAGKVLAHNVVQIVDAEGRKTIPGQIGEVVVSGPTVMREYWKRPSETAAAIRDGSLWTGDLGWTDEEGFLYVAGRARDLVVFDKVEIYPSEIERVLRQHPAVSEAAVVCAVGTLPGGFITAFVVLHHEAKVEPSELSDYCTARLTTIKRPHRILFRDSLPRNSSGKIIRERLKEMCGGN